MSDALADDLVSRLRAFRGGWKITKEAADEIERLRAGIRLIEVQDQGCGGNLTPSEIYRSMQRICAELLR